MQCSEAYYDRAEWTINFPKRPLETGPIVKGRTDTAKIRCRNSNLVTDGPRLTIGRLATIQSYNQPLRRDRTSGSWRQNRIYDHL